MTNLTTVYMLTLEGLQSSRVYGYKREQFEECHVIANCSKNLASVGKSEGILPGGICEGLHIQYLQGVLAL